MFFETLWTSTGSVYTHRASRVVVGRGSELGIRPQRIELIWGILLRSRFLPEACRDFIKCPAFSFRHLEVREDEEDEQQHGEDDEDVWACELLMRE